MNIPFSPAEMLGALAMLVAGVTGYAELRQGRKQDRERIELLEADVEELKKGALTMALLEQTTENLNEAVKAITAEAVAGRNTMENIGKALVRIETKLELQERRV